MPSLGQRRLWTLTQLRPQDPAYQQLSAVRLQGPLQAQALQAALAGVCARHASLRARFPVVAGQPVLRIEPAVAVPVRRLDLTGLDGACQEEALRRIAAEEARTRFDLQQGPLLRAALVLMRTDEAVLLLVAHHMVIDGWSLGLLIDEMAAAYAAACGAGPTYDATPPSWGIAEHIAQSLAAAQDPAYAASVAFWKDRLAGLQWSRLPGSGPAPGDGRGCTLRLRFDGLLAPLDRLGRALCVTRYQLLVAAFVAWAGWRTGRPDVAIATLLANRPERRHQDLVGFLANTVVLRHGCAFRSTVADFVAAVAGTVRELLRHGQVSLHSLAEAGVEAVSQRPAILFALQNQPRPDLRLGEVRGSMVDIDVGIAKFDLSVYVAESTGGLDLWVEFDASRHAEPAVREFVAGFRGVLDAFLASPPGSGATLQSLLPGLAPPSMLAGPATNPAPEPLAVAFMRRCAQSPGAPALQDQGRTHTLGGMAHGIALLRRALAAAGARPGDRVALLGERGWGLLCAAWACLADGLCYVPLGASMPPERLQQVLEQARPAVLVHDGSPAPGGPWRELALQSCLASAEAPAPDAVPPAMPRDLHPAQPAYLMFTSGSTGVPKGVVVTQGNLAAFAHAMDSVVPHGPGDTWLAVSSLTFDIAVLELMWSMSRGLCVRLARVADLSGAGTSRGGSSHAPAVGPLPGLGLFYFGSTSQYTAAAHASLLRRTAAWADAHGFCALWTPERHFSSFGGFFSNPAVTGAHLAAATSRIGIRAGSVIGPLHATPRLAEDWAAIDRLSDGRAGLSLAAGWNPSDFVLAQRPLHQRRDVLEQQVRDLRTLWNGGVVPAADPDGRYFAVRTGDDNGRRLPLWLTVSNRPDQFVFAAEQGLGVLTHLLEQDTEQLSRNIEAYRLAWDRRWGADAPPGHVALMLHTLVHDDDGLARRLALPHLVRYLAGAREALRSLAGAPDPAGVTTGSEEALLEQAALRLIGERSLVAGADEALRRLSRLYRLGVDEIGCLIDFGPDESQVLDGLGRLAAARDALAAVSAARPAPGSETAPVTHLQCTPSAARLLLAEGDGTLLAALRCWAVGGEALDAALLQRMRAATGAGILNLYGPTEATVWASAARVRSRRTGPADIGLPIAGYRLYVLDENLDPVPPGVEGQLFIAGAGVSQGYWRQPAATARAFVPDLQCPGERMYATGDRARLGAGGTIEFLGRNDGQIKVDGHRIELDGIRAVLAGFPEIADAVVAALPAREDGPPAIVAFVVPRPGVPDGLTARLISHLSRHCEVASLPRDVLPVASIPLTPHQKTDIAALAALYRQHAARRAGGSAAASHDDDDDLRRMRALWAGFVAHTDDHVDFHRLGGNSLTATRLLASANREFGVELSLQDFYRHPTIAGHLAAVRGARPLAAGCPLVPMPRDESAQAASAGQTAMLILDALGQAPGDSYRDVVVLELEGRVDGAALRAAFDALAARHRIFATGYRFAEQRFEQRWNPAARPEWDEIEADPDVLTADLLLPFVDRPFDLSSGRVLRGLLARRGVRQYTFCLVLHHVVSDGATIRIVLKELLETYRQAAEGQVIDQRPARWQYADFADWQRRHLERHGADLAASWRPTVEALAALPARLPGTSAGGTAGVRSFALDAGLTAELEALAQRLRVGLLALVMLPWVLLEEHRTGQPATVPVATDARNRPLPEFEDMPGMTVNQLLLAMRLPRDGTVAQALLSAHDQLATAFNHQAYPYEKMASQLRASHGPAAVLFDLKVVLNEPAAPIPSLDDLSLREVRLPPRSAKFGVLVNMRREGECMVAEVVFDRGRHDAARVERWCSAYPSLLAGVLRPDAGLPELRAALAAQQESLAAGQRSAREDAVARRMRGSSRRVVEDASDV